MTLRSNMARRRASTNKERGITESTAIIPGLPDDVGLSIVARLPRALQSRCRVICHAWKDAMEAARMGSLRKALHISEEWPVFVSKRASDYRMNQFLFTIVDPWERRRRNIPLPKELKQHEHPHSYLYFRVIGAMGSEVLIACILLRASEKGAELQGVYSFDGLRMKWAESKYSALPNSLSLDLHYGYASAADMDGGYLYVAGGYGLNRSLQGVERLDTKTRVWETLPDPHFKREGAVGFVLQGLFHLIGGWHAPFPEQQWRLHAQSSGEIWDPANHQWRLMPELWPREVFGGSFDKRRIAVLNDRLYALRRVLMTDELMYYESVSKAWTSLGCIPLDLSRCAYHLYDIGVVCLLAMGEELWVIDRSNRACVATKPTCSQSISWKTLPCTYRRSLPIRWKCLVAALHV